MRDKFIFYEESVRIPLILRFPGVIPAGLVVDEPVSHLDLHSTFRDYVGADGKYETDGSSLRRHIDGTNREDSFVVAAWDGVPTFMARKANWKFITGSEASNKVVDMLFDLEDDPHEMNNLLGSNSATATDSTIGKAEHLRALLQDYLVKNNHPAAETIKMRRTWPAPDFWVGDSSINFRPLLKDGTRMEWLYIGSATDNDVSIEGIHVTGKDSECYSIHWDGKMYGSAGNKRGVVEIVCSCPGTNVLKSDSFSANITIKLSGGGGDKTVLLLRPKQLPSASLQLQEPPRNLPLYHVVAVLVMVACCIMARIARRKQMEPPPFDKKGA
jgi:hypothetical protein